MTIKKRLSFFDSLKNIHYLSDVFFSRWLEKEY